MSDLFRPDSFDEDSVFKHPVSGSGKASSSVEGVNVSKASRSLQFDQVEETAPRMTRSKVSFKDVPIEELDKQFVPPDAISNFGKRRSSLLTGEPNVSFLPELGSNSQRVYNVQFDEMDDGYTEFLRETFYCPTANIEASAVADTSTKEDEVDPDYNFQDGEDLVDTQDDFRFDKSTV